MASLAGGGGDGGYGNVRFSGGFDKADAEVMFLPIDPTGAPDSIGPQILQEFGLGSSFWPTPSALAEGHAFVESPNGRLCFVVVSTDAAAQTLERNLTAALLDEAISNARSIWLPLMGAPSLAPSESRELTLRVLEATGWISRPTVQIVIYDPGYPGSLFDSEAATAAARKPARPTIAVAAKQAADRAEAAPSFVQLWRRVEPAVAAAFGFAAELSRGRKRRGDGISTTVLFYALAESQTAAAPAVLRSDPSASLFAGAVHALARRKFREAWSAYFFADFQPEAAAAPPQNAPAVSANVGRVMDEAAALAQASRRTDIAVNDLIVALLNLRSGRHQRAIEAMGVTAPGLLAAYQDARVGKIGTALLNDVAAVEDRLGYKRYAAAITGFLLNAESPPPLSVSIQAPWGAGKSSLMQQIREALDPKQVRDKNKPNEDSPRLLLRRVLTFLNQQEKRPQREQAEPDRLWTVWFNAWKYDSSEQVWAGLVDAIVDQVSARLPLAERELFLLKLQLARIDDGIVRRKIYDRIVTIWWGQVRRWTLVGVAAIGVLFGLHKTVEALAPADWAIVRLVAWSPYAPLIVLALFLARTYFTSREKTRNEPAAFSLSDYVQAPAYDLSLGAIHHIHHDLLRVLHSTPVAKKKGKKDAEPTPLVIFIDDLDRCSPTKVAAVVEGVSMFLASEDYGCIFVIGMDPQMIAAALEDAHSNVRSHLPRYERTVPLGWRFMDKFIQLPFTIPPSNDNALKSYIEWLSNPPKPAPVGAEVRGQEAAKSEPDAPATSGGAATATPTSPAAPRAESETAPSPPSRSDAAEAEFIESREVGRIIQDAAANTSGNPREIKRLANLTRLYLGLRNERRKVEPDWRSPSTHQYARWIVLTLKWPDMVRWLQWGADEFAWPQAYSAGDLTTRRLRLLEDAARACPVAVDWTNLLVLNLKVPGHDESDWATDPKLFEFFTDEAELEPDDRLSAAAASGFW